jgi:hypothetical protein
MDNLERLVAIEDIKNLKARYLRCADGKQWDEFETLFTPDAEFIGHDVGDFRVKGTHEFRQYSEKFLVDCLSVHHVLAPEITFIDDKTAKVVWVMTDMLRWEKGDPIDGYKKIDGWGHYHETCIKTRDGWRMSSWELTRVKLERSK